MRALRGRFDNRANVHNESDRLILDVSAMCVVKVPGRGTLVMPVSDWFMRLPAGKSDIFNFSHVFDAAPAPENGADLREGVQVMVHFTDADGRRWISEGPGQLTRADPA